MPRNLIELGYANKIPLRALNERPTPVTMTFVSLGVLTPGVYIHLRQTSITKASGHLAFRTTIYPKLLSSLWVTTDAASSGAEMPLKPLDRDLD